MEIIALRSAACCVWFLRVFVDGVAVVNVQKILRIYLHLSLIFRKTLRCQCYHLLAWTMYALVRFRFTVWITEWCTYKTHWQPTSQNGLIPSLNWGGGCPWIVCLSTIFSASGVPRHVHASRPAMCATQGSTPVSGWSSGLSLQFFFSFQAPFSAAYK